MLGATAWRRIRNQLGHPIGAIGIYAPATSLDPAQVEALGQDLAETALRISGMMGMNPPEPWSNRRMLLARDNDVEEAIAFDAGLGSSPVWLARQQRLAWVDITRKDILIAAPGDTQVTSHALPEVPASIVADGDRLLAMIPQGIVSVSPAGPAMLTVAGMPASAAHMRFNSSKCDSRGRLWVTTQDVSISRPIGQLCRVEADGTFVAMAGGFLIPIGLGWSPDDKYLYLCDAPRREIYSWKFDAESGEISERRIFARVPEGNGRPAGLAVDVDGFVWNVQADGWSVTRYDPAGRIERIVPLPVPSRSTAASAEPKADALHHHRSPRPARAAPERALVRQHPRPALPRAGRAGLRCPWRRRVGRGRYLHSGRPGEADAGLGQLHRRRDAIDDRHAMLPRQIRRQIGHPCAAEDDGGTAILAQPRRSPPTPCRAPPCPAPRASTGHWRPARRALPAEPVAGDVVGNDRHRHGERRHHREGGRDERRDDETPPRRCRAPARGRDAAPRPAPYR